MTQAHIYIIGDVIGVGFRAWTKIHAKHNNIKGWIRNAYHNQEVFGKGGGVEAIFQGDTFAINTMIELIKKGPTVSRVDDVEVYWQTPTEIFSDFEIRK